MKHDDEWFVLRMVRLQVIIYIYIYIYYNFNHINRKESTLYLHYGLS